MSTQYEDDILTLIDAEITRQSVTDEADVAEAIDDVESVKGYLNDVCNHQSVRTCDSLDLAITALRQHQKPVDGSTSDGHHTFDELYDFRRAFNAVLFNEWASQNKYSVHKSERHSDGEQCFGGEWFIVVATLPTGDISNHYEMKHWDLFQCEIREKAKEWDGHQASVS